MPRLFACVLAAVLTALAVNASVLMADPPRIFAGLELSALSVTNDVAEATFKVLLNNEEEMALSGVFVVFEDGFEVSIGDVAAESSAASDSVTRTFDLSQHLRTLHVSIPVTLKYSAGGNAVEQPANVVLRLAE